MADPDAKFFLEEAMAEVAGGSAGVDMEAAVPMLAQFLSAFAAPGFVCVMHALPPTPPTTYPGVEGLEKGWADYAETFETVRADFKEIVDSEGGLVILVDQIATTRHGGVEMSQPSAMVFRFEAGRVTRLEFHLDHAEALRSAGVQA
jgi:ketosteroid isomerase-like protein